MGWIKTFQIHQVKQDSYENGISSEGGYQSERETLLQCYCRNIFRNWKRRISHCVETHIIEILEDWPASRSEKYRDQWKVFQPKELSKCGMTNLRCYPNRTPAKSEESEFRKCGELPTCTGQVSSWPHTSRKTERALQYAAWQSTMKHNAKDLVWHLLPIFYRETQTSLAGTPMSFALSEA